MRRAVMVGAVLAGGLGSRLGGAKAIAELGGRPLVSRVVGIVGAAGLEPVVVAKPDTPLPRLDCRVLTEPPEPRHPLTGLIAALDASAGRGVIAVGCDMPLVPRRLLSWLAGLDDALAVCEVGGRLQPLLGRYPPAVSGELRPALDRGEPFRDAVAALGPRVVREDQVARFGDPHRIAFNVNSPEDLERARELLARS
ncbi:MAG TPA: molybdenum cofactor guanylyltransferase [Solirubrobacterales bacterium]|jgi:molybdenum cofactor guanylyltransferase|nr:molybdenum cofactor guanylyltransferase [Solirubrobacterales bacterium]